MQFSLRPAIPLPFPKPSLFLAHVFVPTGLTMSLAASLLSLATPAVQAQNGANGTPGANGTTGTVKTGSFTFNNPGASYQGIPGGNGGDAGSPGPLGGDGGNGGNGGNGGDGLIAPGVNANISVLSGTFTGGGGGNGGGGTIASPGGLNGGGGDGGNGGDAFAATGAGTHITILGGTFDAGIGGNGGTGNGSNGGAAGNDFSTSAGETAFIYGGNFAFRPDGGLGVFSSFGPPGAAFALNGSNVTLYGSFEAQQGDIPFTTPQTLTDSFGYFYGTLVDNTGPAQQYLYSIASGGSLTLVPAAVPEASTTASFGLLLALGLGGLIVAAKRKKAASSAL